MKSQPDVFHQSPRGRNVATVKADSLIAGLYDIFLDCQSFIQALYLH